MEARKLVGSPFVNENELRYLAILSLIERGGPQRFTDFGSGLKLHPNQVNRALKKLVLSRRIKAHVVPGEYPNRVRYELTTMGEFELRQARERLRQVKRLDSPELVDEARNLERVVSAG
jgi:DNA-binding HxlR family transcriptional regulator